MKKNVILTLILASVITGTACQADDRYSPPWQGGKNNDAIERGLLFTVPDADNLADFHGSPQNPALTLYVGGNYFFAMAPLVKAFEQRYPHYRGRLYWQTLPPGLLMQQIRNGGTITVGNMTWKVPADVYLAGLNKIKQGIADGVLSGPAVPYVTNTLTIMVAKGNPKGITGLQDLGAEQLRLAMPNPAFEGVARQIESSLKKAGSAQLADQVYRNKVQNGTTTLTHIHHRQTPLWIMQGRADAGVTWLSEAIFQQQAGHPIDHVTIPAAQNTQATYAGARVKGALHPQAASDWLTFIVSPQALAIFQHYGFEAWQP